MVTVAGFGSRKAWGPKTPLERIHECKLAKAQPSQTCSFLGPPQPATKSREQAKPSWVPGLPHLLSPHPILPRSRAPAAPFHQAARERSADRTQYSPPYFSLPAPPTGLRTKPRRGQGLLGPTQLALLVLAPHTHTHTLTQSPLWLQQIGLRAFACSLCLKAPLHSGHLLP